MLTPRELNCQECGACCAVWVRTPRTGPRYVEGELTDADVRRLHTTRNSIIRRKVGGRVRYFLPTYTSLDGVCTCAYLRGKVGKSVACVVYKNRPYACKWFPNDRENIKCVEARLELGVGITPYNAR